MNLLIAIMGDSYEKVKETERVQALHERAKIIVDMEMQHPGWHKYPRYMHIAEAADEYGVALPEWAGITGRMKQLLDARVGQAHEEIQNVVESKTDILKSVVEDRVGAVESKVDAVDSKVDAVDSKVDAVEAKVDELAEKLSSIEALLVALVERQ